MLRRQDNGFRNLIAWQEAKSLSLKIYHATQKFPAHEQFQIVSQLRRAASSVMANLAEGSAMSTKPHRISFYQRARGSVVEVDNFIELSFDLHYISESEYADICDHCARLSFLITKLMQSLR